MTRAHLDASSLRLAVVLAVLAVLGGAGLAFTARDDADAPAVGTVEGTARVGEPAPDFALESLTGEVVRLSDFRGQTVILNFWATWCLPCYLEMPAFQALYAERQAARGNLVVLAVNMTPQDSRSNAEDFAADEGLTFPVLLETDAFAVSIAYGLERLPGTFFIDRDGVLREVNYGIMAGDALLERVAAAEAVAGQ